LFPDTLGEDCKLVETLLEGVIVLLVVDYKQDSHILSDIINIILLFDVRNCILNDIVDLLSIFVSMSRIVNGDLLNVLDIHTELFLTAETLVHEFVDLILVHVLIME